MEAQAEIKIYLPDGQVLTFQASSGWDINAEADFIGFVDLKTNRGWDFSGLPYSVEYFNEDVTK